VSGVLTFYAAKYRQPVIIVTSVHLW